MLGTRVFRWKGPWKHVLVMSRLSLLGFECGLRRKNMEKKMEKRGNVKSGVFQISSGLYQFLREKVGVLEVFWI